MPDPNLKAAAEEIKAVLRKYDAAGLVMLSSASHMEYLRHFDASWSVAKIESPGLIRVRSKLADFGGDKAAQKKSTEATVGMLIAFAEHSLRDNEALTMLIKHLGNVFGEIRHISFHEEEDN